MRHLRSTTLGFPPSIPQTRASRRAPAGRATPRARTRRLRPWLARVLFGAAAFALLLATSGERAPAQAEVLAGNDWMHALYAVAGLATHPPQTPVVVLMGGSAARESTISDPSWREDIADAGGPPVVTRNLSSRNQGFAQDLHLVRALPDRPTLVLIGINPYRFCATPALDFVRDTGPFVRGSLHRYDTRPPLGAEVKEQIAAGWMRLLYDKFDERFAYNVGLLDDLVKTSLARGQHPVLLDMPRNTEVVGDRMDLPVSRYSIACQEIAARYDIPFISFATSAGLVSDDFHDNAHLIGSGKEKWQKLLADSNAGLLAEYGMGIGDDGSATTDDDLPDWVVSPWTSLPVFLPAAEPSQD